jgi:hypothetical protein
MTILAIVWLIVNTFLALCLQFLRKPCVIEGTGEKSR